MKATADDWNFCGSGQREISSSSFCFPTKSPKSHPWQTDTAKNSGANLSRKYMAVCLSNAVRSADFCFQSEELKGLCVDVVVGAAFTSTNSNHGT